MNTKTLKQLPKYTNKWVALSEPDEKIVGCGKDVTSAKRDAKKKGYSGEITYFKVFPFDQYIPQTHEVSLPKASS